MFVDAGPIGPAYLSVHGHGDIYSYELSLDGRRVVVDGGTSTYQAGPERDWVRSTRAHNTVEVAGADQCEFFGAFRVGRRGRPRDVSRPGHGRGPLRLRLARRVSPPERQRRCTTARSSGRSPRTLLVWDTVRVQPRVPGRCRACASPRARA